MTCPGSSAACRELGQQPWSRGFGATSHHTLQRRAPHWHEAAALTEAVTAAPSRRSHAV